MEKKSEIEEEVETPPQTEATDDEKPEDLEKSEDKIQEKEDKIVETPETSGETSDPKSKETEEGECGRKRKGSSDSGCREKSSTQKKRRRHPSSSPEYCSSPEPLQNINPMPRRISQFNDTR